MMPSPGLERTAQAIAENVVSAFDRERDGAGLLPAMRETMTVALVRELLAVLPTASGSTLAAACNRALDDTTWAMGFAGPRVAAVDAGDGAVTMRAG